MCGVVSKWGGKKEGNKDGYGTVIVRCFDRQLIVNNKFYDKFYYHK